MAIRYLADADFNQSILLAVVRRDPTIDFETAAAGGVIGLGDPDVLATAARAGRILVTHDRKTMPRHFAEFVARQPSLGVILVRQSLAIASVVEDLILIHGATEPDEWMNRLAYLPV